MHYRIATAALSSLLVLTTLVPVASAQRTAQVYLERRHDEVNELLRQPAETDAARRSRSERLTRILEDLLDYQALSENALGDHWGERSETERTRFVALLQQLVERNYENSLERILDFEVTYDGERRRGEQTIVTTSARSRSQRRQPPVEIEYTVRRVDGSWRVIDVTTDGVSMVQNYRSQFNRIIGRDGWEELIARMERRLERSEG
ncbi:MAG: phospholipid-binding protein MlaC [Sandaracinaceae bacterium]